MTGDHLAALIAVLASLILVTRGLRSHQLSRQTLIRYGLAWAAIIAALVLLVATLSDVFQSLSPA